MIRKTTLAVLTVLVFFSALYARSVWNEDSSVYRRVIREGDIIRIVFLDKTILKYKMEERATANENTRGKKGRGEVFSFFPDAEASQSDNRRTGSDMTLQNETRFALSARVVSVTNNTVYLAGISRNVMNGETFVLELSGESRMDAVKADFSILSTDVYNLYFQVRRETPANQMLLTETDLVFQTNYTEIASNFVAVTNSPGLTNQQSNLVVSTNMSRFTLELKGVSDEKKREMILNYLNNIVNSLFRK